jgi:hypothetical protein
LRAENTKTPGAFTRLLWVSAAFLALWGVMARINRRTEKVAV